jgi:hypothetical protein
MDLYGRVIRDSVCWSKAETIPQADRQGGLAWRMDIECDNVKSIRFAKVRPSYQDWTEKALLDFKLKPVHRQWIHPFEGVGRCQRCVIE